MTKEQLLKDALGQIEKQFGEGTIMRLGDNASMAVSYTHLTLPTN